MTIWLAAWPFRSSGCALQRRLSALLRRTRTPRAQLVDGRKTDTWYPIEISLSVLEGRTVKRETSMRQAPADAKEDAG